MIFLIEFDVHDGVALDKLYVSTNGIRSGPTDTPANQFYSARLKSVGSLERTMFSSGDGVSGGTTTGRAQVGFGNISVVNGATEAGDVIDDWKDLAFRNVTIKSLVNDAQPFAQAVTRFIGSVEQLVATDALEQYDMIIHDRLQDLEKPLLTATYAGTTTSGGLGTAEGDEDMTDQIKQKLWGTVHNVRCVDVNHFDLIWQVSDGPVLSITAYDGGIALTNDGDVGNLTALFAASVLPSHYVTCVALGLFRSGAAAIRAMTADVVEGSSAALRTAGQIVSRMLTWFSANYGVSFSIAPADLTALDAVNAAECGIIVHDTETAMDAIARMLNSIGAWMLPQSDSATVFDIGRFEPPSGSAVASYDFEDSVGAPQRVESGDDGRGIPAWKIIVRYDQLDVVQTPGELFGQVTENDPIRTQYLGQDWRQASAEDASVLTKWPNAPTLTIDTRLISQAAAQAEAARLLSIYGTQRDIWRLTVSMSDDPDDDPGISEVVELTSRAGRMGLGAEVGSGENFRCIGRVDDFDDVPLITLTLWG